MTHGPSVHSHGTRWFDRRRWSARESLKPCPLVFEEAFFMHALPELPCGTARGASQHVGTKAEMYSTNMRQYVWWSKSLELGRRQSQRSPRKAQSSGTPRSSCFPDGHLALHERELSRCHRQSGLYCVFVLPCLFYVAPPFLPTSRSRHLRAPKVDDNDRTLQRNMRSFREY